MKMVSVVMPMYGFLVLRKTTTVRMLLRILATVESNNMVRLPLTITVKVDDQPHGTFKLLEMSSSWNVSNC